MVIVVIIVQILRLIIVLGLQSRIKRKVVREELKIEMRKYARDIKLKSQSEIQTIIQIRLQTLMRLAEYDAC